MEYSANADEKIKHGRRDSVPHEVNFMRHLDTVDKRKPSSGIAGKGRILGDIISPVSLPEDWEVLK
ncbi:hypothetical protein QUF80_15490 [Desulfococcaceae bacterium HSG8]|nr:hypothetical protein [Desulfococcaceae bacterium HSG8]